MTLIGGFALYLFWKFIRDEATDKSSSKRMLEHGMKIIVASLQIIATFSRLQTNFTSELVNFFDFLDLYNLNLSVLGFECGSVLEQYWGLWRLKLTAPFIVFALFLFVFLFSFLLKRKSNLIGNISTKSFFLARANSFIYGYLQSIVIIYTLLMSTLVEPFFCLAQADGTYTMVKNPSIQCYSDSWNQNVYKNVFPFGFLYGILIPLGLSLVLYIYRKDIDSSNFKSRFGFLTSSYRRECYWYELVAIGKRVLFMLLPEFIALRFSTSIKLFTSLIILIVFQIHFGYFQPCNEEILNILSQM